MTVKAKRFRIGVEGATTDGREIQREWLEQMAASYNPAVYIWSVRCSAQSDRSCGYCTGGRGAGCLEILATHHRISRWRGGRIQSGGRSHQCSVRTA
ncbi:GPO family capsid scaffolding protein [Escherichia coli]|nr:GPO family capsid scaffolding protein [Escherichia coli]